MIGWLQWTPNDKPKEGTVVTVVDPAIVARQPPTAKVVVLLPLDDTIGLASAILTTAVARARRANLQPHPSSSPPAGPAPRPRRQRPRYDHHRLDRLEVVSWKTQAKSGARRSDDGPSFTSTAPFGYRPGLLIWGSTVLPTRRIVSGRRSASATRVTALPGLPANARKEVYGCDLSATTPSASFDSHAVSTTNLPLALRGNSRDGTPS